MDALLIQPKIIRPRRRRNLITRKRLLDLLRDLLEYKLVLVIAPGGYGKTSLLIDYASHTQEPVCWFTLDSLDQDLRRFLLHFTASISKQFPEFESAHSAVIQMAETGDVAADSTARFLAAAVYESIPENFVLVLDDFQEVNESQEINEFLSLFIRQASENTHLVLLSRSLVQLPDLPLMVSRSQAVGLGFRELEFQPDEIQALLLQNYQIVLTEEQAKRLCNETEGWITGLLLSSQYAVGTLEEGQHSASVSGVGLYEYLAEQVFSKQPPVVQDFLLKTSIFEAFNAEICGDVFGIPPDGFTWERLIKTVIQENLFILQIGNEEGWVRYYNLFQAFLQGRLSKQPELAHAYWRKYAQVSFEKGDYERAYAIYQRLESHAEIAALLEKTGPRMIRRGQITTLNNWLELLPGEIISEHPFLIAQRGLTRAVLGDPIFGLKLLDQAAVRLKEEADSTYQLVGALTWRGFVRFHLAEYQQSILDVEEAYEKCGDEPDLIRWKAEAARIRGLNYKSLGDLDRSIKWLTESLMNFKFEQDSQSIARLSTDLGAAYLDAGAYQLAINHYQPALEYYQEVNNLFALPGVLNDLGFLHYLRGEHVDAMTYLEEAVRKARQTGNLRVEALALASIGDLYNEIGVSSAAKQAYLLSRQLYLSLSDKFMLLYLDLAEAALARLEGDLPAAQAHLNSAGSYSNQSPSTYEKALYWAEAGRIELAAGNYRQALEMLGSAASTFEEGGQRIEACRAQVGLAQGYFLAGNKETAVIHLRRAFEIASHVENQHFLLIACREVKALLRESINISDLRFAAQQILDAQVDLERQFASNRQYLRRLCTIVPMSAAALKIQALGSTRVTVNNKVITHAEWQTQKTRALFFLLLTYPEGMTKEALGEILWPDSSAEQLKLRFKNTIYRLRRAFPIDLILLVDDKYLFDRRLDYEYDVEEFWLLLDQAPKETDEDRRIAIYHQAVDLYQGPFLPDIPDTWTIPERERVWKAYTQAVLYLMGVYLQKGDHQQVVDLGEKLLAQDPCLEEAHRKIMMAYAGMGNRTAVYRQYERCKSALLLEYDLAPSEITEQLYLTLVL